MRLIDTDELMDFISEHAEQIQYAIEHKDMGILESLIKQIPTAYDVDKVLEQLEVGLANECVYERDQKVYTEAIRCAIEIVKGGGVNE